MKLFGNFDDMFNFSYFNDTIDNLFQSHSKINIMRNEGENGAINFYIDLPGIKQEDVVVKVLNSEISVKAQSKDKNYERSFSNNFSIPKKYDPDTVLAKLENGVLLITIKPKALAEDDTARQIPVLTSK